jgi:hypothetical protein
MNPRTLEPDHIEDWLCALHAGSWFGWSDPENKVYANLIIHDDQYTKPTEEECNAGLAAMQAAYDAAEYQRNRAAAYPSIQEQLDMQYWDSVNGTTTWADAIAAVKAAHPKGA